MTIDGGDDSSRINNYASNVYINCTDSANDTIYSSDNLIYVTILGGAGSDSINNESSWSGALSGAGGDYIYSSSLASNVYFDGGDSNDTINNYSAWATLTGGNGDDSINSNVENTTILYSKYQGNDTIRIRADNNTIYLTDVSLDDIQSISNSSSWSSGSYSITFTSSNVLKVDWQSSFNNYDHTVKFSDGKDYTYDRSSKSFVEK